MADINPHWDDYILWLATPKHEREITTEEAWAKSKGYATERTTRRWKQNPAFIARQQTLTQTLVAKQGATVVYSDDTQTLTADERDYKVVKTKLVESAKGGSLKAQELFMKLYGKSWLDEEASARTSDYSNLELPDLVAKAAAALDVEILIDTLEELGYTVTPPKVEV